MAAAIDPATTTHIVSGKILLKENGAGVGDLIVELFDLEGWADPEAKTAEPGTARARAAANTNIAATSFDGEIENLYKSAERVGSTLTDAQGRFSFEFGPKDFNLPGKAEQKPDLFLVVLAPDEPGLTLKDRVLHTTRNIYLNAGRREAFILRLSEALLSKHDIFVGQRTQESQEAVKERSSRFIAEQARARAFDAEVGKAEAERNDADALARKAFRKTFASALTANLAATALPGTVMGGEASDGGGSTDGGIPAKTKVNATAALALAVSALGLENEETGIPVNLYFTPKDLTDLGQPFDGPDDGYVRLDYDDLRDLSFRTNSSERPGTLLISANPILASQTGDSESLTCAKRHTDLLPPEADAGGESGGAEGGQGAGGEPSEDGETGGGAQVEVVGEEDLPSYLARLLRDMPSPDSVLQPGLTKGRATREEIEKEIAKFSLPKGPAELPAKYYFSSLQVAFDHVWKQLFDEAIPDLAFTANTLAQNRFGHAVVSPELLRGGLLLGTGFGFSTGEIPAAIARHFDITREEYNELSFSLRGELGLIANEISLRLSERPATTTSSSGFSFSDLFNGFNGRIGRRSPSIADLRVVQRLTEQGDRLIESVRDDDYHSLHKTLRDLNQRMSGTYEFTVFAADKDHCSVNFGILNTYEQEWTPLAIQPGRLVKTIPLAPKEERRYSVKTRRLEKRSAKEARKNNRALTNEQASTSRVESEIIAKAQTKTNFGLTAQGEFDIGIAEGTSTTTFGVEAASESAETRKDFRESVLKAAQEFKDELAIEIASDTEYVAEGEESGLLINQNEELGVTFLFYELQKRFRLAERLYRVMPVVMVAQEVPSPDQITPAWVLTHDWILRRVLLDDSFRAALDYLANNSVGEDYGLREMRKNLRQQRNLVETLRIEFSAASAEADNRYSALANKIEERIQEESDEATDGFFSDVGDFFGGDGQSPEAAKARELAAKDAHQYALEKAEKAAAALRLEVNNLHTLTEAYNKTVQRRLDNETRVKRLLVHLRNNIIFYMQAIWSHEPADQRYLRLHKVKAPPLVLKSRFYRVKNKVEPDLFGHFREAGTEKHKAFLKGELEDLPEPAKWPSLVEISDLGTPLGFLGNYMIFPMKAHNALTEMMAAPYVDSAFGAIDPDELGNVNLEEFSAYVCRLREALGPTDFEPLKKDLRNWLEQILASPLRNGDEIVVPTGQVFIESLVDPNPILEDYKLKHRALDVYKVQEEVRRGGLENLRLAARLMQGVLEDPDIEKKIVVQGAGADPTIDVDQP